MARVVSHVQFERDVRVQFEHLRSQEDVERISRLLEDLHRIREMLARFPESGHELTRSGSESLRKLRLRRSPFFVWYSFEQELDGVMLFRLFHTRQETPTPRLP